MRSGYKQDIDLRAGCELRVRCELRVGRGLHAGNQVWLVNNNDYLLALNNKSKLKILHT